MDPGTVRSAICDRLRDYEDLRRSQDQRDVAEMLRSLGNFIQSLDDESVMRLRPAVTEDGDVVFNAKAMPLLTSPPPEGWTNESLFAGLVQAVRSD